MSRPRDLRSALQNLHRYMISSTFGLALLSGFEPQDSFLHIQLYGLDDYRYNTVALLDTGCLKGNWVSWRKIRDIDLLSSIGILDSPPLMLAVNGQAVHCYGSIVLRWRLTNMGTRVHTTSFYVFDADHIDVIFGAQFLYENGVVTYDWGTFAPLTPHNPLSPGEPTH